MFVTSTFLAVRSALPPADPPAAGCDGGTVRKVEPGRLRLRLLGRFGVEGDLDGPAPTGKAEQVLKVLAAKQASRSRCRPW